MGTKYSPTRYEGVRSYETLKGIRYEAQWRDKDNQVQTKGGIVKLIDAKNHRADNMGAKVNGKTLERSSVTYDEWWAKWFPVHAAAVDLAAGTRIDYANWHRLYVSPSLGALRLVDIQPTDVLAMLASLADKSARTRQAAKRLASQALKAAVPETVGMDYNPAGDVRVGKSQRKGVHALTVAQVETIEKACPVWLARVVRAAARSGLRPSELCGLQRRHYDPATGVLTISEALRDVAGHKERRDSTKTFQARRIKIKGAVADDLTDRVKTMLPNAPLFPARFGGELSTTVLRRAIQTRVATLIRDKKLEGALPKSVTTYTLRHTCATILHSEGVSSSVAAKYMGHDPVEFLRTYVDVWEADLDEAADALAVLPAATDDDTQLGQANAERAGGDS